MLGPFSYQSKGLFANRSECSQEFKQVSCCYRTILVDVSWAWV